MPTHTPEACPHIDHLPAAPAAAELAGLRKSLRRRKPPAFDDGFYGSNARLGEFRIEGPAPALRLHWRLADGREGSALVTDLNLNPALEADRLAVGWLVANMFRLDGIHSCEGIGDPQESLRVMGWFAEREDRWRHWALVPAGHMRLPA